MPRLLRISSVLVFAATCQASAIATCSATVPYSQITDSSCDFEDPSGAYARVTATESYSIDRSGVFHYTAQAHTSAWTPWNSITGASISTSASAVIDNVFILSTAGPTRPGFLSFGESVAESWGEDAGINWGGSGSYSIDWFSETCLPTEYSCVFPSVFPFPVTLGDDLTFSLTQGNFSSSFGSWGLGEGQISTGLSLEFFEADGTTAVPITSAVATTPEPSTFALIGAVLLGSSVLRRRKGIPAIRFTKPSHGFDY
jgi:hypothetical protein